MAETKASDTDLLDLAAKAAAVIVLRALALAACAIVMARLLPEGDSLVDATDGVVPLWVSVGLMIGLFVVVLAAWAPVQGQWIISFAELTIAAAAIVVAWVVGDESDAIWRAVPLLASVWLAFAAVDLARTVRRVS
jgi:hypothetical protein